MKITTGMIHQVDHPEFDRAVSKFYGTPYSVALAHESSNDSTVSTVGLDGGDLDEYDADEIKQWQESGMEGHSPRAGVVLPRTIKAGEVPAGKYVIHICW